jgi:hypothetical protein
MTDSTNTTNNTTVEGLRRAQDTYHGPWDTGPITTAHLPTDVAHALLQARGWRHGDGLRNRGPWISPTGHREWDTDLALKLALTAEVLDPHEDGDDSDEHVLRAIAGAVVEHDPNLDTFRDEVVTERIAIGSHPPLITVVSENRLLIASRFGPPTDLWQRLADHIHDVLPALAEGQNLA